MYIRAEEYCKRVFDGTHDSPKPKDEGRLLITSKNILNQELNFKDAYLISPEEFDKVNKRSQIHQWDILFSMIGTVGSIYLERNSEINYCIKNMGVFSCGDKDKAEWLYYYLQSDEVKKRINAFMSGAVQKFVPLQFLRNLPVPEYDESKRNVAIVLSSIDKRIENLRAQNRVLEQTAKTIYDYTFLQCAGHQTTYNKTLNRNIPTNWEVKKLSDVADILSGGTPKTARQDFWDGDIPWLSVKDFNIESTYVLNSERKITKLGLDNCSATLLEEDDIVMSARGTVGVMTMVPYAMTFNQSCFGFHAKNISGNSPYFLYYTLKTTVNELVAGSHGSVFNTISRDDLGRVNVVFPDSQSLDKFNVQVKPIFKKQLINTKQIETLTTQRNTLLPLLMTGQITIK